MAKLEEASDPKGFALAYPNGSGRLKRRLLTWNAGDCCGFASKTRTDDIGFIEALARGLIEEGIADPERIYAAGMSNGGMMAHRLACESKLFSAVADVAGTLTLPSCRPPRPVSILMVHGTADGHVPYRGGRGPDAVVDVDYRSIGSAFDFWTRSNACRAPERRWREKAVSVRVREDCAQGTVVALYSIKGEGHTWPGGLPGSRRGDKPTGAVSASKIIVDFFSRRRTRRDDRVP